MSARASVGEVAWLRVLAIDERGAILDWGRPQDLVLPRNQAVGHVAVGDYRLVFVTSDRDGPFATMLLNDHIADEVVGLRPGDRVTLVIGDPTDLGVKAVVNHRFWGLLYANELFKPIRKGQTLTGYVTTVRQDAKVDITLKPPGYSAIDPLTDVVLARLKALGGRIPLTDRSPPEAIQRMFGVSKKQFKQAVGALYKRRRIALDDDGIRLLPGHEGE